MEALEKELKKLKNYYDANNEVEFKRQADLVNDKFTSEKEQEQIKQFSMSLLEDLNNRTDEFIREVNVRLKLEEVMQIVSMSYIAKKYFNRTRHWLYQKINGNFKNGKSVCFTQTELNTLDFALKDISHKIGSVNIT